MNDNFKVKVLMLKGEKGQEGPKGDKGDKGDKRWLEISFV